MECIRRIGKCRRPVAARLGFMEMGMEHDVGAAPGRGAPTGRFYRVRCPRIGANLPESETYSVDRNAAHAACIRCTWPSVN